MKILCAISGIEFDVQHFPGYLSSREAYHPIFNVPQHKLLSYIPKWSNRELTDIDSYLLYLSLLNSTGLIQWRVPAKRHAQTRAIVASHMESLVRIIGRINVVSHPSFVLHKIAVSHDNCDLLTSHFWIKNWTRSYTQFLEGYKDEIKHDRLALRERALNKFIRDPNTPIEKLARNLADWADEAGEFPKYQFKINGNLIACNEYWKQIIVRCTNEDRIIQIPESHLEKLLDYCEENIDGGSSYAYTLFHLLRNGLRKQKNYLGLDEIDFDSTHPGFKIIRQHEPTLQDTNKAALIAAAPLTKPKPEDYQSRIAYLRAELRWKMAQEDMKEKEITEGIMEHIKKDDEKYDKSLPSESDTVSEEDNDGSDSNDKDEQQNDEDLSEEL